MSCYFVCFDAVMHVWCLLIVMIARVFVVLTASVFVYCYCLFGVMV